MLDPESIERVDRCIEVLIQQLQKIGKTGEWGGEFEVKKPDKSNYYYSKVTKNKKDTKTLTNKNWIQVNIRTFYIPAYGIPKPWCILARFVSAPGNPLWEKKPPYKRGGDGQPLDWSPGGPDVWAISYESLAEELSDEEVAVDVLDEILADLKVSWAYSNQIELPPDTDVNEHTQESAEQASPQEPNLQELSQRPDERIDVTISINSKIWDDFMHVYARSYKSRRKHPKRKSYATLCNLAIDTALSDYIDKWNRLDGETI